MDIDGEEAVGPDDEDEDEEDLDPEGELATAEQAPS